MSAAGFERVNVTHRKLFERPRGEFAVVDYHHQREAIDRVVLGRSDRKMHAIARSSPFASACKRRPADDQHARQRQLRLAKASGSRKSPGDRSSAARASRADGGDHHFRAFVQPVPE